MRAGGTRALFHLLLLLACGLFLSHSAQAQISFVQITDPHLYDEGDEADNKEAMSAFVKKVNERVDEGADYKFIIVTGDIGVENVVSTSAGKSKPRVLKPEAEMATAMDKRAMELAALIAPSRVKTWLFLPGNNDLVDESPATINFYRDFIRLLRDKLRPLGVEVVDLCPEDPAHDELKLGVYRSEAYTFVGFNNASFKNNNTLACLRSSTRLQRDYVGQVVRRLGGNTAHAYVFYHIPELDDPHPVLNGDLTLVNQKPDPNVRCPYQGNVDRTDITELTPDRYRLSSWYVGEKVREDWNVVVNNSKVKGLFAGHYHDWRRSTYEGYKWLDTTDYRSGSLSKLYVCPPLSTKFQKDKWSQARGYQEVYIDKSGGVSAAVSWYISATQAFEGAPASKDVEAAKQLRLGQLYEMNGQLKEAAEAFGKALGDGAPATKQAAFDASRRVAEKQVSPWNQYIFTPLGWSLTPLGVWLLTSLLVVLLFAVLYLYLQYRRKNKLGIVNFIDTGDGNGGALFSEVLKATLDEMADPRWLPLHTGDRQALIDVPRLWESSTGGDLAAEVLPAPYGGVVTKFFSRFDKPEYQIQGSVAPEGNGLHIIIRLHRLNKSLRVWQVFLSPPDMIRKQRELSSRVISYLYRRIRAERLK
jgi:hypothetical protein